MKTMISPVYFILVAVSLTVVGQMLIKLGLNSLGNVDFSKGIFSSYITIFCSPHVLLGAFLYSSATLLWLYALSKVDLSFAYPFLALSYVLIILLSIWFLDEHIPFLRWVGVFLICLGVLCISQS